MSQQLYELSWIIRCDEFSKTEWHVFSSLEEATTFGLNKECELNDGLSAEEKAHDGYCYRYFFAQPLEYIENYRIVLEAQEASN